MFFKNIYLRRKIALFFFISSIAGAQTFVKFTDSPFADASFPPGYPGASWIDYDNNGTLDLFVNYDLLFKNEGGGAFSQDTQLEGQTVPIVVGSTIGSGNTWADYDNDGDLDLFFASSQSFLFNNDGSGHFTKVTDGEIGNSSSNRGWTATWGDYDSDGNIDLLLVHPANFVPGGSIPNTLFHNDGPPNYTFTKVTGYEFLTKLAPYTVASWTDYDLDGDLDLFIASGPAGSLGLDYLYKNMLKETGGVDFERITSTPLGSTFQNGQLWNWIDYDNDGDLDGFLTNYRNTGNRLYNNNNGNYTDVAGSLSLSLISNSCLANTWGDFDNDGYLDVIITSESKSFFFHNNGDGTFSDITNNGIQFNGRSRAATSGDFDNDGDLDVFISGFSPTVGLYINDNSNNNGWLKLKLVGTMSNRAAIGTKVRAKATISGNSMWQIREVSAQNTFNSHNSLEVHFGLGDASIVDSLVILWPSGNVDVFTNYPINKFETVTEGGATGINDGESFLLPSEYRLEQNYPNPFNPTTKINYSLPEESLVRINIYDSLGQLIDTPSNEVNSAGNYQVVWNAENLSSGVYFYSIHTESTLSGKNFFEIKKMIVLK